MKQTINFGGWVDAFHTYNRYDTFTYDGHKALFDYYEEYEDETNEQLELDVIAICCDWAEYDEKELLSEYGYLVNDDLEEDCIIESLLLELEDRTSVIKVTGGKYTSYLVTAF